jgi:hypothetical protein
MDENDIVETEAEDLDALLAQQEEEIEFQNESEESEDSSTTSEHEEPELILERPEELVPTIATMSVVVGGTTLNLELAPTVLTTTSMTIFKKKNRSKLTEEK